MVNLKIEFRMFNVRSLTQVLRTLSKIYKKGFLLERALNVRLEKTYFNAWVVICKHKDFQGIVKCMFLITCV